MNCNKGQLAEWFIILILTPGIEVRTPELSILFESRNVLYDRIKFLIKIFWVAAITFFSAHFCMFLCVFHGTQV